MSYIIFIKANKKIVQDCGDNDYYTVFLWTYPEHRGYGLATMMARTMLHDLDIKYDRFYKTIGKDNFASTRVAEKCGFRMEGESTKTRWLHTIQEVDKGDQFLYSYQNMK